MVDPYYERLRLGKLRNDGLNRELLALNRHGFHIETIRLSFKSAASIYSIGCKNEIQQERIWSRTRDFYEKQVQEWLINAYMGNTRSNKRKRDTGWKLIAFWDRGKNDFLHCHGFLLFYTGEGNALSYNEEFTMKRLQERQYHHIVNDIHLRKWRGPKTNAVAYAGKGAWRPDSGCDILYAAVGKDITGSST